MHVPLRLSRFAAAALCAALVAGTAAAPVEAAPPGGTADRVEAYVAERMAATETPGLAYALVGPEEVEHVASRGRDGDGQPVTADTPFLWGSVSKPVTATVVLSLAESGALSLDDPVRRHLPSFTLAGGAGGGITVGHLLEHTSGIPGGAGVTDRFDQAGRPYRSAVADLADVRPVAAPGHRHVYASANYLVLGAVVEAATGRPFTGVVAKRVLRPLGIGGAVTTPEDARNRLPPGHRYMFGRPVAMDAPYDPAGVGYGYLGGSVTGLARFAAAQLGEGAYGDSRVLSAESAARMQTGRAEVAAGTDYGLGWRVDERNRDLGTATVWHAGAVNGYQAMVVLLPEARKGVVVVQNAYGAMQDAELVAVGFGAARIAAGAPPPSAPDPSWEYPALLAGLCSVLVAGAVLVAVSLRRLRHRPAAVPRWRVRAAAAAWTIGCLAAAWSAAVVVPGLAGADLRRAFLWAPDAAALLAAVAVVALTVCALRSAGTVRALRTATETGREAG
ncbi:serine hydrolase domain-containing protein [Streptomonospora salina]|uniref:CubicO group peptidase (Beta-lactamase class C family) n=1 Tax=Streptomonospora salina TaxID=104205 RepID=A0A841E5X1_9ACTN|nr:serine hydrolase domain-containing protein [Streptomonospora salina]MBB5998545.1 CubicO group peptidase (beta-lactamase class C family) [Streptomonospora salina]